MRVFRLALLKILRDLHLVEVESGLRYLQSCNLWCECKMEELVGLLQEIHGVLVAFQSQERVYPREWRTDSSWKIQRRRRQGGV